MGKNNKKFIVKPQFTINNNNKEKPQFNNNKKEKPQSECSPGTIFVSNLPFSCTDSQLQQAFTDVGPLKHSFLVTKINQKGELKHRGFGVVQFANVEDAGRAIELKNRTLIGGRKVLVKPGKYRPTKPKQDSDDTLKTDVPIQPPKKSKKPTKGQAGESKSSDKQTRLENETDSSAPRDAQIAEKPASVGEIGKPVKPPKKPKKPVKGQAGDGKSSEKQTRLENETDNSAPRDAKIAEKPPRKRKADDQSVDNKEGWQEFEEQEQEQIKQMFPMVKSKVLGSRLAGGLV